MEDHRHFGLHPKIYPPHPENIGWCGTVKEETGKVLRTCVAIFMLQQHLNSQSCPTNASSFFQQLLSIGVSVSFFFFVFSFIFPAVLVVDARLTRGTQSPSQWFAAATSLAQGCDSSSSSSSCLKL